jgi:iron-sulfur cluster assembly accessory protein
MISVTQKAADHIKNALLTQEHEALPLRISVVNGGCNGHEYRLGFDDASDGDQKFDSQGIAIVVDEESQPFLSGLELDYVETLEGSRFVFRNPNAVSGCGCGKSFGT